VGHTKEKEGEGEVTNPKNGATSSQPHTQKNVTQKSAGPSQLQQSPGPQAVVFSSPAVPVNATPPATTTPPTPRPNAVILQARCCTNFLCCIRCVSQFLDAHNE